MTGPAIQDPIAEYWKKYGPGAQAPDPIAAYQSQYGVKPTASSQAKFLPTREPSYGEDVLGRTEKAVNSLTFGAYPKLVGLIQGSKQQKDAAKARIANQTEEDKGSPRNAALSVLPQVPGFLASGPAAAATKLGRLAQMVKAGATFGGLEAGGHAEGSIPEQLKQTATGAVVGGVAAPIAGGLLHGAAKGAQWLGDVTGVTPLFTRAFKVPLGKAALGRALDQTAADLPAASAEAANQSPHALAGGPVAAEMAPVVQRGMQQDNALYNVAAKKIKGLYKEVRSLGEARDAMFRNGPDEKIPVDDQDINDMLQTKVPIVQELIQKTKAKMRRIGRPLPVGKATTITTLAEAAKAGQGVTMSNSTTRDFDKLTPEQVKAFVSQLDPASPKLGAQVMVETTRDIPTMEFLANLKESLGAGAEALFKRKLGGSEARALSEFLTPLYDQLKVAAPEYGTAQEAYSKASKELEDALALTKGRLVKSARGGKRVVFKRTAPAETPTDLPGVRSGVKFADKMMGSPSVNMAGTGGSTALLATGHPLEALAAGGSMLMAHAGREASRKEIGRSAAEAARLLLQSGSKPVLADALAQRTAAATRRRLAQQAAARAAGKVAGNGLLDPFLRQ
jgi:hypothetical protein